MGVRDEICHGMTTEEIFVDELSGFLLARAACFAGLFVAASQPKHQCKHLQIQLPDGVTLPSQLMR